MDFIDNIHLTISNLRPDPDLVDPVPYIVDRIVRGGIQFMDVKGGRAVERQAGFAFVACFRLIDWVKAVDRFGQDTCAGGFAHSPWTAKQECLRKLVVANGVF